MVRQLSLNKLKKGSFSVNYAETSFFIQVILFDFQTSYHDPLVYQDNLYLNI